MKTKGYLLVILTVVIMGVVSCATPITPAPTPVTESDAMNALALTIKTAKSDPSKLCEFSGSYNMCKTTLVSLGGDPSIPTEDPVIVKSFFVSEKTLNDGKQATGGWILTVEGIDGLGNKYQTDFFVIKNEGNQIRPMNAIYWSGIRIDLTLPNDTGTPPA